MTIYTFDVFSVQGAAVIMADGVDILHIHPIDRYDEQGNVVESWRECSTEIYTLYKAIAHAVCEMKA